MDDAPAALRLGDLPYQRSNALKAPSASATAIVKGTPASRSIPLDIKSAIAPYKGRRRLSLRIEDIPQSARLSAGTNNGDGTWSLALDEIEDLSYLPSEGSGNHALRLRVISKEDDVASTVALLDLPVTAMPGTGHSSDKTENSKSEAKASAKIAPSPKTPELRLIHIAERGRQDENPPLSDDTADRITRELASARALWEAELRQHTEAAAAEAALNLRRHQAAWAKAQEILLAGQQKETTTRVAEAVEITRWELQAAAELDLQRHKTAWTEAQERFAGAQQKEIESRVVEAAQIARQESQAEAVRTAEQWRNAESTKLASIEARWRAREEKTQKQADLRFAALVQQAKAERDELLGELQAAKDDSNKSGSALKAANLALTQQEETWKAKLETALAEAKALWAALEDTRLKEVEARLTAQLEQTLAERSLKIANVDQSSARAAASHAEEIDALNRQAEARDFELARLRTLSEENAAAAEASFKDAQETWQRAEAERFNEAEAKWQADLSASRADHAKIDALTSHVAARDLELTQLRTHCEGQAAAVEASLKDARETWQRAEAERLNAAEVKWQAASSASPADRGKIDALTSQVKARDLELAGLRAQCDGHAAATETALKDAQAIWQRAETERLNAAEAKWQADLSTSLARCQALGLELGQTRSTGEVDRGGDDAYIARINREIKTLKATVADREAALAHTQASLDRLRRGRSSDSLSERASLLKTSQDESLEVGDQKSGHLVRDAIILMVVVIVAILAFPTLESFLPDDLKFQIESLVGSHDAVQAAPVPPKIKAPTPSAVRVTATISRSANMRIAPLPSAAVVSRLKAGLTVTVLEKKGYWERIDVPASNDKHPQGWVYDANMRNAVDASRPGGDATP